MATKTYQGWRMSDGVARVKIVLPDGTLRRLPLRLDLFNHSPTGFEWAYAGSGPAQLALALLADAMHNDLAAKALHQAFKFKVVGRLPRDQHWEMTDDDVIRHAANVSELPLMRLTDGSISRCCPDCTSFLLEKEMIRPDALGVYDTAPGYTFEDTKKAVAGRHDRTRGER
jgi:hypothetical protein